MAELDFVEQAATPPADDDLSARAQPADLSQLPPMVPVTHPVKGGGSVPREHLQHYLDAGYHLETVTEAQERTLARLYGDREFEAFATSMLNAAFLGIPERVSNKGGDSRRTKQVTSRNPVSSVLGTVASVVVPGGGPSMALKAGRAVRGVGGLVAGATTEGLLLGAQGEFVNSALEGRPVDAEKVISGMGTGVLLGVASESAFAAAGAGLRRGGAYLAKRATRGSAGRAGITPEGEAIASEIGARSKQAWSTPWDNLPFAKETKKVSVKAAKAFRNLGETPEGLARRPYSAMRHLEREAEALRRMIDETPGVRAKVRPGGEVEKVLNDLPRRLEDNLKLQDKIVKFSDTAREGAKIGVVGRAAQAAAFVGVTKLASGVLGPFAGSAGYWAARKLGDVIRDSKGLAEISAKLTAALSSADSALGSSVRTVLGGAKRAAKGALPSTNKMLREGSFGPTPEPRRVEAPPNDDLHKSFRRRERELRSLTYALPDGTIKMRPEARRRLGRGLAPVRAVSLLMADRMETAAARRVEYLSGKLPKRPALPSIGPDTWRPSDMEMHKFARAWSAVEDLPGALERVADGTATPDDTEALRAVYPEIVDEYRRMVMQNIDQVRRTVPYERRLTLSMLLGVPVDPAMDPRVLRILQGMHETQGDEAPPATPAFGSVQRAGKESSETTPTPAQKRAG